MVTLGRLEQVPLRQVWPLESRDFTPWLAAEENLALLAYTLGLGELVLQGTELPVGNFNLDILAEDIEGHIVLIENQFGPTDHNHLGQILTYLAGQSGNATVVWIAERIREEHRAAIDWLNASTREAFNFYAVQVEALKIGDSSPAPRFNIVAKPNTVSRVVGRVTREADGGQLDERSKGYVAYWSGFGSFLQDKNSPYKIPTPPKDYWYNFGIGRSGFVLSVQAGFRDKRLSVDIYINHQAAKRAFDQLLSDRDAIEEEFGTSLVWQRLDNLKSSKIGVYRTDFDPRNDSQRPAQYQWFLDNVQRFTKVFGNRIRNLSLNAEEPGVLVDDVDQAAK